MVKWVQSGLAKVCTTNRGSEDMEKYWIFIEKKLIFLDQILVCNYLIIFSTKLQTNGIQKYNIQRRAEEGNVPLTTSA